MCYSVTTSQLRCTEFSQLSSQIVIHIQGRPSPNSHDATLPSFSLPSPPYQLVVRTSTKFPTSLLTFVNIAPARSNVRCCYRARSIYSARRMLYACICALYAITSNHPKVCHRSPSKHLGGVPWRTNRAYQSNQELVIFCAQVYSHAVIVPSVCQLENLL